MVYHWRSPPWYQDFSDNQMKHLMNLNEAIRTDHEEITTTNTQTTLTAIGVISTGFKISSKDIKKLHRISKFNVIDFLREVYKILTGNYFEDETPKIEYGYNERIILSSLAFLTLPETIIELHKRLPPVTMPKLPPKPIAPTIPRRRKRSSPYEEELFTRLNWSTYRNRLREWHEKCELTPVPKIILPPTLDDSLINYKRNMRKNVKKMGERNSATQNSSQVIEHTIPNGRLRGGGIQAEENSRKAQHVDSSFTGTDNQVDLSGLDIPRLPDENKIFDFTLPEVSQNSNNVSSKICGIPKQPQQNMKSWLGEKDAHFIIAGVSHNSPVCSITYELTGIAKVTPCNSDERFFSALNRKNPIKKIYPKGRENLSRKWQEWLQNVDEEFTEIEIQMDKVLRSMEETLKLIFPEPVCDGCCSCRQTRKIQAKLREIKSPYVVVETIATHGDNRRTLIGSIAMHSPAPSLVESEENIEIIPSRDTIIMAPVIHGSTKDDKNEVKHLVTDLQEYKMHLPSKIIEPPPPRPLKNVPPCECTIQQMFSNGLPNTISNDNIPWTKDDGLCYGKKYRPDEFPAYSCMQYPGDKSCRNNPLKLNVTQLKRKPESKGIDKENVGSSYEQKMYSIADFQPCGDEHGMALCGGPWGSLNIYSSEELEEQKRIAQEILKAPPCGQKPGRAVCEGPWGTLVPETKAATNEEEEGKEGVLGERIEDIEEDEDEDEDEEKKEQEVIKEIKKRPLFRDKTCFANPEILAARKKKVMQLKTKKFIPDLNYPAYDDPWNLSRTAPSRRNNQPTDYEKSLKLTPAQPQLTLFDYTNNAEKVLMKKPKKSRKKQTENKEDNERLRGGSPLGENVQSNYKKYHIKKTKRGLKVEGGQHNNKLHGNKRKGKKSKKSFIEEKEDEVEAKRKSEMLRLKNMMLSPETYPYDVEPAIIPEDPPRKCQPPPENILPDLISPKPEENVLELLTDRGPCGWRTKSQQDLPTKKNLIYLVDPDYPMEMIPLRKGGTPCTCRDRRNKKKVLVYAIGGFTSRKGKTERNLQSQLQKNKEVNVERRVLEGVFYYTPTPSPRRSDEYIPEYELYESPYKGCKSKVKNRNVKQIEMYLTPKDLISKTNDPPVPCKCTGQYEDKIENYDEFEKIREDLIQSKPPEERWALALKDIGLMEYFTSGKDNIPCWMKCKKYAEYNSKEPLKRLQAKRPVCECMYERKILSQKEEEKEWKERQSYLKKFKKQHFLNITDTSMPTALEKKLLISDVQRIPRDDEFIDDIKYCVSGVSENYVFAPPQTILAGINMTSPIFTPQPSKPDIPSNLTHRHWSPTNILPGPLPTEHDILLEAKRQKEKSMKEVGAKIYEDVVPMNLSSNSSCKITCLTPQIPTDLDADEIVEKKQAIQNKSKKFKKGEGYNKKEKTQLRQRAGGDKQGLTENENEAQNIGKNLKKISMEELLHITKAKLKTMAEEGFLFPKLSKSYLMPQLQIWLMYRHGFTMTDKEKQQLMINSSKTWNQLAIAKRPKIEPPPLGLSKRKMRNMTYNRINEIKQKVEEKKAEFFRNIQEERVAETQAWWPSMQFLILPNKSFKNAYFTYMASKQTDGHVFKPWKSDEILQQMK